MSGRTCSSVAVAILVMGLMGVPAFGAESLCNGLAPTLVGTSGDDVLQGTNGDDVIAGLGGADSISGRRGNDVICGGAGGDSLRGQDDDDRLFGGKGRDDLDPGHGNDYVNGGTGDSFFWWSDGDDVYDGSGGARDLIDHFTAPNGVQVDLPAETITGLGSDQVIGIEVVWGSRFDDTIIGDDAANHFAGRDGNDTLSAGGGGIFSGNGPGWDMFAYSNVLSGEGGDDTLIGGSGYDAIAFFDSPAVTVNLAAGTSTGDGSDTLSGIEGVITSRAGDTISGNDEDNAFAVAGHAQSIDGRGGSDLVVPLYAFGGDELVGVEIDLAAGTMDAADSGMTSLTSIENAWGTPTGDDVIRGTDVANKLSGRGGNDKIYGRAGDDFLNGGRGRNDLLVGGLGTDRCVKGERLRGCEAR